MRSPMVENASYITDKSSYSDLQVMMSTAGWYIGTDYQGEPGSRDSGYYRTEQEASAALVKLENNPRSILLRMYP